MVPSSVPERPAAETLESTKVEPPSGRLQVGTRQVELPKGWLAERELQLPSAIEGQSQALVWAVPASVDANWNGPLGALHWLAPTGESKVVLDLPPFIPTGAGCTTEIRLAQLSPAMALLDVHGRCERSLPQRTPNRAVVLLGVKPAPAFLLGLRVAEPAADETLGVSATSADRDGDGRDDPSVRFDFEVVSTHVRASAAVGWLDRAAGLSMDEGFLSAELEPTFKSWEQGLKKRGELSQVSAQTAALRRLLGSLCQQSTVPRVFDWHGEPLRCPSIQLLATKLARLEISAALNQGDVLEAAHALRSATTWLGGLAKSEADTLTRRITKAVKTVQSETVPNELRAVPRSAEDAVRYSPLRFAPDGSLLVQTESNRLMRLDLQGTATDVESDAGASPWPLSVTAADGRRWFKVVPSCDRSELALALYAADGSLLPLMPTRLLSPRPGVCRNPTTWPFAVSPIGWQGDSPTALIDSACWSGSILTPCPAVAKLGPVVPGSPRSPDGSRLVAATPFGPIVLGGTKPELWPPPAPIAGKPLSDCAVANEARALACIGEQNAVLLFRRVEPTPKK